MPVMVCLCTATECVAGLLKHQEHTRLSMQPGKRRGENCSPTRSVVDNSPMCGTSRAIKDPSFTPRIEWLVMRIGMVSCRLGKADWQHPLPGEVINGPFN